MKEVISKTVRSRGKKLDGQQTKICDDKLWQSPLTDREKNPGSVLKVSPKSVMEQVEWKRINYVEQDCAIIVIEMRKLRVEFEVTEVKQMISKKR